jgi:PIN domain nuclease of toxin-antitoxin system
VIVLDASALLTLLRDERGSRAVRDLLDQEVCAMSTVNYAEVLTRLVAAGGDPDKVDTALRAQGLIDGAIGLISALPQDAIGAAALWASTRHRGLSLGDRICLATAKRFDCGAATTDRAWADIDVGVRVVVLRGPDAAQP